MHQVVWLSIVIGVQGTGWVEREGIRASHAPAVGRCFGTVTGAVAVAVWIALTGINWEAELIVVGDAVAVHVVVHEVANTVAVHIIGDAGGVERFALAGHLGRVEVAIVVVVIVCRQTAWAVWVDVRVSIAVGVDRQGRVKR